MNNQSRISRRGTFSLILLANLVLSACTGENESAASQQFEMPPQEVAVHQIESRSIALTTELPGRLSAVRRAEVRPQVTGIVIQRLYEEGTMVKAGQPLYQLDDRLFRAAVASAEADLAQAQASLEAARLRLERMQRLRTSGSVGQQDLDDAETAVAQAEASEKSAAASLQRARIDLDYTQVRAPIDGRISRSQITEGALVSALQPQPLTVIQQLDPIYLDIQRSADELVALRQRMQSGELDAVEAAEVTLDLDSLGTYPYTGTLQFSDIDVAPGTGSVTLRATFPNPDNLLLPGMFAHANLQEALLSNAILVPQQAVFRARDGRPQVYLVNQDNQIELRTIQTERAVGSDWLVTSGVRAGDRVVTEGLQKIGPGSPVSPVSG